MRIARQRRGRGGVAWSRACSIALTLVTLPVPGAAQRSMFRGNPGHTGFSTADAPSDSTLFWVHIQPDSIFYFYRLQGSRVSGRLALLR